MDRQFFIHSLCDADYVDDVFGDGSLWPSDPYVKAMSRLLVSDFGNKVCWLGGQGGYSL